MFIRPTCDIDAVESRHRHRYLGEIEVEEQQHFDVKTVQDLLRLSHRCGACFAILNIPKSSICEKEQGRARRISQRQGSKLYEGHQCKTEVVQ